MDVMDNNDVKEYCIIMDSYKIVPSRFGVCGINFRRYKPLFMRASLFFLNLLKSIDLKSRQNPLGKDERTRPLLQRIILDRAKH